MQNTLVRWLTLAASLMFGILLSASSVLACDLDAMIAINTSIQRSNDLKTIKAELEKCGQGVGTLDFEIKRRVNKLYIGGVDSEVQKFKVASLTTLYLTTGDTSYLDELKKSYFATEHGYLEYCMWQYFSGQEVCDRKKLIALSERDLPHATWASANFVAVQQSRLTLLEKAVKQGHVDAEAEYLIAVIDKDSPDLAELKDRLFRLIDSGESIDAEIYYLRMLNLGRQPFTHNPKLVVELATRFLKYRDIPEYYYLLSIAYFDLENETQFQKYLSIAAEMGNEDAISFKKSIEEAAQK
ncbi:hypothetical protein TUM3794_28040 [Shewanella colwelliana]|uniref:DUF2989 domain-containing protein n=1 Tax=Shewanella colwelliana TaxID=23 RepID=A0ABQ4P6J3_SHECO|nr:hypothetical protein [Shewanella colwelliana]GIU43113.1 hypothetical protein TUM3794_28040 [Shewanella colwelliana]